MGPTLSLIRREFSAYFYSPIAYVVLAVFLAVTGHLFVLTLDQLTETGPRGIAYPMEIMAGNVAFWLMFLFIPPLLTMRLIAEERSTGTLEMLLTAPIQDWQVVFAKYFACFGFYTLMWLPTLLYLPVLTDWRWSTEPCDMKSLETFWTYVSVAAFLGLGLVASLASCVYHLLSTRELFTAISSFLVAGVLVVIGVVLAEPVVTDNKWRIVLYSIDPWPIVTTYIGLALAGAMFLAIGLFVSSLVNSQMIAAIVSLAIGLFFIGGMWGPELDTSSLTHELVFFFTVPMHFEKHFIRGVLDTRQLVLYGSVTLFGLFMTVRSLESRRWQ
ncbi:MAG: ABC transporter permease [Planctomycetes bacterium]|nr:ABC transporter permease [Planctomycetota bacterium]